jgi:hypothetical protein
MAVITTLMTSPLLSLLLREKTAAAGGADKIHPA